MIYLNLRSVIFPDTGINKNVIFQNNEKLFN